MTGFMGMGMAMNAGGGMNAQNLFAMGQQQQQQAAPAPAPAADGWKCSCGATVSGKFCPNCGTKKPEPVQAGAWKCSCGATATGKFCPECGSPTPTAGSAPAARSTRANSALTAAQRSPQAFRSTAATNAAGSPRIPRILPNSVPNAATRLTTAI